jgi:NTP pyrophosphatase (non-canonical NTP hydrolase)
MVFKELNSKVIEWAEDKGIFSKATSISQHSKTIEEVEELTEALEAQEDGLIEFENHKGTICNTDDEIKDAIGDILVTLIIQSKMQGMEIEDCLESAYNVISKRTGKMIGGVFVKDK